MEQLRNIRFMRTGVIPLLIGVALLATTVSESRAQEAQASLVCAQQFDANGVESWICMKEDDETVMDVCPETEAEIGDCVQLATKGATITIRFDGTTSFGKSEALIRESNQLTAVIAGARLALLAPGGAESLPQIFRQFTSGSNESITSTTKLGGG